MLHTKRQRIILTVLILSVFIFRYCKIILYPVNSYFRPYYTENVYKQLENLYNNSQYRLKNPTSIIADEIVYRYTAGAYLRGVDPIMINSESLPLGKYILAVSVAFFQTDGVAIAIFGLLAMVSLWFLTNIATKDIVASSLVVLLFSYEKLYQNQLLVTPLLDIIQLPWILFALYFFIKEYENGQRFIMTSLMLGLVMATKSIVPALLLGITFLLFLMIEKKVNVFLKLILVSPFSILVVFLSYIRTFLNGYTVLDFVKFQKWIFDYQQSKLIYPLSVWRLIFLNQWQTWWGDRRLVATEDWQITWPMVTIITVALLVPAVYRKIVNRRAIKLLLVWICVYALFLSLGVTSTRFFLPFLPVLYILTIYTIARLLELHVIRKINLQENP